MKTLFFILIGLSLGVSAQAQYTVTFPPGHLASEEWVQALVKKKVDSLSAVIQSGLKTAPVTTIPTIPATPVVTLPNCVRGPIIKTITYESGSGVSVLFDGEKVYGMDYLLLGPLYEVITKGSITPTSNIIKIGYPNLSLGSYHLTLTANTCTGKDSKDFIISKK